MLSRRIQTNRRDPRIDPRRLLHVRAILHDSHAAEFVDLERLAIEAEPGLPKQDRPRRIDPDGKSHYRKQRAEEDETEPRADDIEDALRKLFRLVEGSPFSSSAVKRSERDRRFREKFRGLLLRHKPNRKGRVAQVTKEPRRHSLPRDIQEDRRSVRAAHVGESVEDLELELRLIGAQRQIQQSQDIVTARL